MFPHTAMNADIRRLYLFHVFNGLAVTIVANYLFIDRLFLRLGLNMSQFGLIKGLSLSLPFVVTLEECDPGALSRALARIARLDFHREPPLAMPVVGA